jgi:hypothetical protein
MLRERNLLVDTVNCCVEEQVTMFLHIVGHNQSFRVIKQNWRRSIHTVVGSRWRTRGEVNSPL